VPIDILIGTINKRVVDDVLPEVCKIAKKVGYYFTLIKIKCCVTSVDAHADR